MPAGALLAGLLYALAAMPDSGARASAPAGGGAQGEGMARSLTGGVYPLTYGGAAPGGVMDLEAPMPYADLGDGSFTDSSGGFTATGTRTTTLSGRHVTITDQCGALSEGGDGDIALGGSDGDVDCDIPAGASPGNTAASRTAFYELNRIAQQARGYLPANGWLGGQVEAEVNLDIASCFAFWDGTRVRTSQEMGPCANPGQIASVLDHEWGHGMDQNDASGAIVTSGQGGGEGIADVYSALRLADACIGRGLLLSGSTCSGYGDPCVTCDGIRTIDWEDRVSGSPHTLTWVRANCGGTVQCVGAAYSEAIWDLYVRDLGAERGFDSGTAQEVTTRLTYVGGGNASGWFDLAGPPPGAAGCGAGQAYLQLLAADDDDGNLANGTPNMSAIAAAFDRHEIGCTPANGGPVVIDGGCLGGPAEAPALTASTNAGAIDLAWTGVAGAASYSVYRTDGPLGCDLGRILIGATSATAFSDPEVLEGRRYGYVVIPIGASGPSCFGPASECVEIGGDPLVFADGFESGDTAAWSATVP